MSCNIKIPLDRIIHDVAEVLSGRYISTDNPFLNEAVLTDTTLRGDITADTTARNALCRILQTCHITADELEWLSKPTIPGQVAISSVTPGGVVVEWKDLEALVLEYAGGTIKAEDVITADGKNQEEKNTQFTEFQNQQVITNNAQAGKNQEYDEFKEEQLKINAAATTISALQYVKGDGTDETEALRAYHTYCNNNGIKASYKGLTRLAVQADAKIIVNTDWDFNGIDLTILGGEVDIGTALVQNIAFRVFDERCIYTTRGTPNFITANLVKGSMQPTKGAFDEPGLVYVLDGNTRVPSRDFGGAGVRYSQSFHILANGQVSQPLSTTLSNATHASTGDAPRMLYRRNSPNGALVIDNLTLTYGNDYNFQKIISVERNNVTINNVKVVFRNWTPRYTANQLITVAGAANFTINGLTATGIPVDGVGGTYILRLQVAADVFLNNIQVADNTVQGKTWGWIGTNFVNGVYVSNSTMGRLDGHESIHNVFVSNTTFTDVGVTYGWGGGSIIVNGGKLINSSAVFGRIDYGNTFFGSVTITDVIVEESMGTARALYSCKHVGSGSVVVYCPEVINIHNITINTSADFGFYEGKDNTYELIGLVPKKDAGDKNAATQNQNHVYAPSVINISNITASNTVDLLLNMSIGSFSSRGNRCTVNISDITAKTALINFYTTHNTVIGDSRKTPMRVYANIDNIITTSGCNIVSSNYPLAESNISRVNQLIKLHLQPDIYESIKSVINVSSSTIYDFLNHGFIFGNVSDKTVQHRTVFYNCTCNSGANLSKAGALQGITLRGSTTLPPDVTPRDAFLGWTDLANFAPPPIPPVVP